VRSGNAVLIAARGGALVLGGFALTGLIGELRGRTADVSLWWIDLRDLPGIVRIALVGALAVLLLAWAVRPTTGPVRRRVTAVLCGLVCVFAIRDIIRFYLASAGGLVHASVPVPLSLFVALGLAGLTLAVLRGSSGANAGRVRSLIAIGVSVVGWGIAVPLAQMWFFGTTDYRRPADAAVVFGARVYASGSPSPLLADRIRTGIELYKSGLVSTLVMSGGDGADGFNEARVMRDEAIRAGVAPSAIVVDAAGDSTEATVANTVALLAVRYGSDLPPRLIAVSQAYHLPRIQLSFATAGIDVLTVPAADPVPIGEMPVLVVREVPAFWVYFLRVCLG
jgi:vancomycin permeability regulator SanA